MIYNIAHVPIFLGVTMVEYRLSLQELNTVWAQHAVATPTQYFHLPNLKVVPHLRKRKAWTAHCSSDGKEALALARHQVLQLEKKCIWKCLGLYLNGNKMNLKHVLFGKTRRNRNYTARNQQHTFPECAPKNYSLTHKVLMCLKGVPFFRMCHEKQVMHFFVLEWRSRYTDRIRQIGPDRYRIE